MPLDLSQLLKMKQSELDDLFKSAESGQLPSGEGRGTVVVPDGGADQSPELTELVHLFGWRGKLFDPQRGVLTHRLPAFGLSAILAELYKDKSWLDGRDCIVLDYSKTSLVANWIRDEVRLISPGLYLGKMYWGRNRLVDFCLEFGKV